jgi:hypothetical protein
MLETIVSKVNLFNQENICSNKSSLFVAFSAFLLFDGFWLPIADHSHAYYQFNIILSLAEVVIKS